MKQKKKEKKTEVIFFLQILWGLQKSITKTVLEMPELNSKKFRVHTTSTNRPNWYVTLMGGANIYNNLIITSTKGKKKKKLHSWTNNDTDILIWHKCVKHALYTHIMTAVKFSQNNNIL